MNGKASTRATSVAGWETTIGGCYVAFSQGCAVPSAAVQQCWSAVLMRLCAASGQLRRSESFGWVRKNSWICCREVPTGFTAPV